MELRHGTSHRAIRVCKRTITEDIEMTNKENLQLLFSGRILQHLGIQLYASPVNAIAEIIANSWDAEAQNVRIELPFKINEDSVISIQDDGVGMTKEECQNRFLYVGANRRKRDKTEKSKHGKRFLMGRKGIGKFAGFGIAKKIIIDTISEDSGERTIFTLDIEQLMGNGDDYVSLNGKDIETKYFPPDTAKSPQHGTKVTLSGLNLQNSPNSEKFAESMARRFFLQATADAFHVFVNDKPMPDSLALQKDVIYSYPRDYAEEEKPHDLKIEADWGVENIVVDKNAYPIKWRINFYKEPIKSHENLKGISIFANKKLAQSPFFFNLSGGIEGQTSLEYMSGSVIADYLDEQEEDLISTERQRISTWSNPLTAALQEWGQKRVKQLATLWVKNKRKVKEKLAQERIERYTERIAKLQPSERSLVKKVISKLADIDSLSEAQFVDLSDSVMTTFEMGALKSLAEKLSRKEEITTDEILKILVEGNILTALHMARVVALRIDSIASLLNRISTEQLENETRDFIAENPWIIGPRWENFKRETGLSVYQRDAMARIKIPEDIAKKRIDLTLSAGSQVLLLEFMRPGLSVDWDHLQRVQRYYYALRSILKTATSEEFKQKEIEACYVIANVQNSKPELRDFINELKDNHVYVISWNELLRQCLDQWKDVLKVYFAKCPNDPRIRDLRKYIE